MLTFAQRGFFKSPLFNQVSQDFLGTLLPNLVKDDEFALTSAKGGTGRSFTGRLAEKISQSADMPYHIHIVNGLFPALKLLEEKFTKEGWLDREEATNFLRCFVVGFTFHDINKLSEVDDLNLAVEGNIERLCEKLDVESFFSEWRDWIDEIKFLALGTEYRTRIFSLQKPIREYEFFNRVLCEHCHLADAVASIGNFENVAEFYEQLCNTRLDSAKLSTLWELSYVEVQENIFTLLSQKLLFTAKSIIQDERKQPILFSLRNGFVYIGEPLTGNEVERIKQLFKEGLFDIISLTQIGTPDARSCNFEFLEMTSLTRESLEKIIEIGLSGSNPKIRLLMLGNEESAEAIEIIRSLIDEYEMPLKLQQRPNTNNYNLYLEKRWDELEDYHHLLKLIGLEKIKMLKAREFTKWNINSSRQEQKFCDGNFDYSFDGQKKNIGTIDELLSIFSKPATPLTVLALVLACEAQNREEDFKQYVDDVFSDVVGTFAPLAKSADLQELEQFVDFYLTGNFARDIRKTLELIGEIPAKKQMCMFTGGVASQDYTDAKTFGISARGFSNRSVNTLKSQTNKVSSLFFNELSLRKKELPRGFYSKKLGKGDRDKLEPHFFEGSSEANSSIYYDFGEYLVDVMAQPMLSVLGKAFSYDCRDIGGLKLILDDRAYDYNLYGMNFNKIPDEVKSNFLFIHQMLKLIQTTRFRIFTTSILTPYHLHNEMFVFENCMPFVKALGWDKIRIDEIKWRLQEMNLIFTLGLNRLVSNVLSYAEDRRYLFTAFAQLKDDEKPRARESLSRFIASLRKEEREKFMSVMDNLAQIAIEMVRPKSGSTSQESWIIRDALKVLKDCHKEGRDEDTTIEQIAGELRKTLKNRDYVNLTKCRPFATALHEQLFVGEWNKRFPQPSRLRNWINQFAFLYSEKRWQKSGQPNEDLD
jgi:hypothetical protein